MLSSKARKILFNYFLKNKLHTALPYGDDPSKNWKHNCQGDNLMDVQLWMTRMKSIPSAFLDHHFDSRMYAKAVKMQDVNQSVYQKWGSDFSCAIFVLRLGGSVQFWGQDFWYISKNSFRFSLPSGNADLQSPLSVLVDQRLANSSNSWKDKVDDVKKMFVTRADAMNIKNNPNVYAPFEEGSYIPDQINLQWNEETALKHTLLLRLAICQKLENDDNDINISNQFQTTQNIKSSQQDSNLDSPNIEGASTPNNTKEPVSQPKNLANLNAPEGSPNNSNQKIPEAIEADREEESCVNLSSTRVETNNPYTRKDPCSKHLDEVTDSFVTSSTKHLDNTHDLATDFYLKCIDLSHTQIMFRGLSNLRNVDLLDELNLSYALNIDDYSVAELPVIVNTDRLRRLDVSGCPYLTEKGLATLHLLWPGIQEIAIRDMVGVPDDQRPLLQSLLHKCMPACRFQF